MRTGGWGGRSGQHAYVRETPLAPLQRVWPAGLRYPFRRAAPPEPPGWHFGGPPLGELSSEPWWKGRPAQVVEYWDDPGPPRVVCGKGALRVPGTPCP